MNTKQFFFCFLMAFIVTGSGCGGGGGGGGTADRGISTGGGNNVGPMMPVVDPMTPVEDPCIRTADFGCISSSRYSQELEQLRKIHSDSTNFSNQWGLREIKADQAYAHLKLAQGSDVKPGQGVTVGLMDTGIDGQHPLFAGKSISEQFLDGAVAERGGEFSHGTAVASVIGAQPTGRAGGFHGVAWGADLKMFAIRLGDPPPRDAPYAPISLENLQSNETTYANLFANILKQDVDVLNLSFGIEGIIENYSERDVRDGYGQTIAALAQTDTQDKTILVWAAGNDHGRGCTPGSDNCVGGSLNARSAQLLSGLVARIDELRGHSIAVVSVDRNGDIAGHSNRCGIAADWCIAAPGVDVAIAYFGPRNGVPGERDIRSASGTSMAAPMVSGSLAIMKHLFRDQLSNTALVSRLFATAAKDGKFSERAIYGQGMLDLGAATAPVGRAMVAVGNTVAGAGIDVRLTSLRLGGALGDGLGRSLAGQEIVAFDGLGAPFWFNLAGFTGVAGGPASLVRLRELTARNPVTQRTDGRLTTFTPARAGGSIEQDLGYATLRFGFRERPGGVEGGHFALADNATTLTFTGHNGLTATAFTASGVAGRAPASGATVSWRPFNVPVGFRAGWLLEQETLLGTTATGAFGRLSADAAMTGLETGFEIGRWKLAAAAEIGTARPRLHGGMIDRLSSLTTSAFAFNAMRRLGNDDLVRLSLAQPLRVEDGRAALSGPVGRTKDGDVLRQAVSANLVPSGRQIDVSARWSHSFTDGNELRFDAAWIHNPGHNAGAKPALSLLAGWQFEF